MDGGDVESGCAAQGPPARQTNTAAAIQRESFDMFKSSEGNESFYNKWGSPQGKFLSAILGALSENLNRDKTSHFDCQIPEHRTARLGVHKRPAARKIRIVVHRARPVRRRSARRPRRCGH